MTILITIIICIVARGFIFSKHDIKPIKTIIPGYNKYLLGKICGKKKLGLLNAILLPICDIWFLFCTGYEQWIMQNYTEYVQVPYDTNINSTFEVVVPKDVANIAIYSKYILLGIAAICMVSWIILMWNFTKASKRSYWWILLWIAIPVIPYCAFAITKDIYIDGKHYTIKKVLDSK